MIGDRQLNIWQCTCVVVVVVVVVVGIIVFVVFCMCMMMIVVTFILTLIIITVVVITTITIATLMFIFFIIFHIQHRESYFHTCGWDKSASTQCHHCPTCHRGKQWGHIHYSQWGVVVEGDERG